MVARLVNNVSTWIARPRRTVDLGFRIWIIPSFSRTRPMTTNMISSFSFRRDDDHDQDHDHSFRSLSKFGFVLSKRVLSTMIWVVLYVPRSLDRLFVCCVDQFLGRGCVRGIGSILFSPPFQVRSSIEFDARARWHPVHLYSYNLHTSFLVLIHFQGFKLDSRSSVCVLNSTLSLFWFMRPLNFSLWIRVGHAYCICTPQNVLSVWFRRTWYSLWETRRILHA